MITFKTVRYKNFLSTGNKFSEIKIDNSRTTLMIGTNGAGKSTFMDAISFGLFGKPFRKIKLGQLVNSINNKNCQVELEFSVGNKDFLIRRGLKPAKFEIYIDGEMKDQDAKAKDQQDFLERYVLKMNEKSFRQIVVLGSGSFVPFMRLSAGDRRSIIEELLDIQIFSVMNDLVKSRIGDNKGGITDVAHRIELLEQSIQIQENHLKELQENKEESIITKRAEITRCNEQIEEINTEISKLKSSVTDYKVKQEKHKKLRNYSTSFKSKKQNVSKQLELVTNHKECPACKQDIDDKHRAEVTKKLTKEENELITAMEDIASEIEKVTDRINEIESILLQITNKNSSITGINEYINRLTMDLEIDIEEKEINVDTKEIDSKKIQLDAERETKYTLQESSHHLNTVQELLKDSGIKTVIIRNYLPLINQLINKYLSELNFYINFELDEAFNETIKSRGRDAFQYGSFSEGEKLRIDLALLFTWREVAKLKSSVATNLLILDEIFDSSLDTTGIEDFLGILNSLGEETNTFVISHKGDQILDKFGRVIYVEKEKNFSRIS